MIITINTCANKMSPPADCLVLKIEETDSENGKRDTNMFILYDRKYEKFIIRGKREDTSKITAYPYSFECSQEDDVYSFLKFVVDEDNPLSMVLYNYDNLHADSDDITFEFLQTYEDSRYEITGYNNVSIKFKKIKKAIHLLKCISNYYE